MTPFKRLQLIDKISRHLQDTYNTSQINLFLGGYGLPVDTELRIVPSKRVYVEGLLAKNSPEMLTKIGRDLHLLLPDGIEAVHQLKSYLATGGYDACHEDFALALARADIDPAEAIGNASSTFEALCKAIYDDLGLPYPNDESLAPLMKGLLPHLNLSPEQHADDEIKRILGGMVNAASGLGVLRTRYSRVHGKGGKQNEIRKSLRPRHARLAINSLTTVGLFLFETYLEKNNQ